MATKISLGEDTIFKQIERPARINFVKATKDIQAIAASAEVAKALGIPKRSPTLRIVEISASQHPGDRFAYSMHIDIDIEC